MKRLCLKIVLITIPVALLSMAIALISLYLEANASSDGEFPEDLPPEVFMEAIPAIKTDAEIAHRIDVIDAKTLFVSARAYPGSGFPNITGGYTETTVACKIQIRGISVPTACQTPESRNRPLAEVRRERSRCENAINYLWGLLSINKKLKLLNPVAVDNMTVECDVQYAQGGEWHDLANALIADEHARPAGDWAWGSRNVKRIHQEALHE